MCGDLYRHDPETLRPLGKADFGGRFPPEGVSAHPKVDESTGEMLFFNYGTDAPYMHYGELSPDGELQHYVDVPLPGPLPAVTIETSAMSPWSGSMLSGSTSGPALNTMTSRMAGPTL